uniref:Uncharacterized protein n=1 Tax=Romanomermis culicivorax TaxID=13658 RepID=A0A915KCH8_ROMCU
MLTPDRRQNEKRQISPCEMEKKLQEERHTQPLDVTSPEILSKFLDQKSGLFDEIAYELVINAYEKFYLQFEQDIKNLNSDDLEQRKKSMRRFTNTQYWAWRKENFTPERCQHFLVQLITLQFYNTTDLKRLNSAGKNCLASQICILENSARKAAYLILQHGQVEILDAGRDLNNLWAGHRVQCQARAIAANTARGLWSNVRK